MKAATLALATLVGSTLAETLGSTCNQGVQYEWVGDSCTEAETALTDALVADAWTENAECEAELAGACFEVNADFDITALNPAASVPDGCTGECSFVEKKDIVSCVCGPYFAPYSASVVVSPAGISNFRSLQAIAADAQLTHN